MILEIDAVKKQTPSISLVLGECDLGRIWASKL